MSAALAAPLGTAVQIAYAVPDAEEAAARWAAELGAGPFFFRPHIELFDVVIRGRPGRFDHSSAYGQWGSIMVELVQDHGDGPSPVRDLFGADESGPHHLAFFVDDPDTVIDGLARQGHALAMSARTAAGVEFHFVDTVATLGHMIELYRPTDRLREFYAMVAEAALGWDGSNPVRPI